MLKKFLQASIIYSIGPQLPKIVGILILPILTPFLNSTDFGIWGTIMAYVLLFSAARDMGLNAPMVNSFFQHKVRWKWVWGQLSFFLLVFGILFTLIQGIVLWFAIPAEAHKNKVIIICLIGAQSLLFDVPNQIGFRYLQLREKPIPSSLISIVAGFIALGVQLYCVVALKVSYMGWFYSTFCSTFFSAIVFSIILYRNKILPIPVLRFNWLKPRLRLALPMLPHNYSAYLLNASDRMVMNLNRIDTKSVGLYNIAYMWGSYMEVFGNAIGMAVGPLYMKLYSDKNEMSERKVYHLTQFLQFSFVGGSFVVAIWAKELFQVFIKNDSLKEAYGLSIIILMSYSYRPLYWNIVSRLQFSHLTSQLWKISLVGGMLNLVLNFICIPVFGYKSAAIITFVALMYMGFSGFLLKEYRKLDNNHYHPVKWLFGIFVATAGAYVLKDLTIVWKIIISLSLLVSIIVFIYKRHLKFLKDV